MAVLLLLNTSCSKDDNKAVILVKTSGLNFPVNLYRVDTTRLISTDSLVKPTEKDFKFLVAVNELTVFILSTKDSKTSFFLEAGETVTVDFSKQGGIAKELQDYSTFRNFEIQKQKLEKEADSLAILYLSAQVTDSFASVREQVTSEFNNLLLQARSLSASFIRNNPESIGVYVALNSTFRQYPIFDYTVTPEVFLFTDSVMQKYHPGNSYSIRMHNIVKQLEQKFGRPGKSPVGLKQGDIFPSVRLQGLDGKEVSINPQEGKIAIVYLWDGNVSSRKSTPIVKMLHEKYKPMGLDTYAIAFTESFRDWTSLIQIDKMWWNNMIDTAASGSDLLKAYNIKRLPYFIVLDNERKVMSHFATADAMEEWITLYFQENK